MLPPDSYGMHLWKGGLGESLPAEKWQQVADFHRGAVPDLLADHSQTFAGVPVHSSLRWARAAAIIRIPEIVQNQGEAPRAQVLASVGFAEAPRLTVGDGAWSRGLSDGRNQGPGYGLMLQWRLIEARPQYILYGWMAREPSMSPGFLQPYDHGSGKGELWLGRIRTDGIDFDSKPTDELLSVGTVYLFIR